MPTYNIPIMKRKSAYRLHLGKLPLKEYCLKKSSEQLRQGNALQMSTPNYAIFSF